MVEKVVLELPENIIQRAREASERSGRSLETILIDWLERSAAHDVIYLLTPDTTYTIETPYGNEAAAKILLDYLEADGDNE